MALVALHLCAQEREAWTDVGDIGVGRASDLTQSDKKRQILPTYALRRDPAGRSTALK